MFRLRNLAASCGDQSLVDMFWVKLNVHQPEEVNSWLFAQGLRGSKSMDYLYSKAATSSDLAVLGL